jgi:hypothetical protein
MPTTPSARLAPRRLDKPEHGEVRNHTCNLSQTSTVHLCSSPGATLIPPPGLCRMQGERGIPFGIFRHSHIHTWMTTRINLRGSAGNRWRWVRRSKMRQIVLIRQMRPSIYAFPDEETEFPMIELKWKGSSLELLLSRFLD